MPIDYRSFFNSIEWSLLQSISTVIIWGYPLGTHTQSFIHACWHKTFNALGKNVLWLDDKPITGEPIRNSLFIAEGYADKHIPLDPTNIYFVNFAIVPEKYISAGCRLIEIRCHVPEIHDINIDFNLFDGTHHIEDLSTETWYEALHDNNGVGIKHRGLTVTPMEYECVYMYWGTDLLPHEFDYTAPNMQRENAIHYVGSAYPTPNKRAFMEFARICGIQWIESDPWIKPLTFDENRRLIQRSILAPDFRPIGTQQDTHEYGVKNGKNHIAIGYLPCRVLKAISYGHLGITDSPAIKQILGDHVEYHPDMQVLLTNSMKASLDKPRILRAMRYIADRHTYLHRARDMLRAILKRPIQKMEILTISPNLPIGTPDELCQSVQTIGESHAKSVDCTVVTALYDIGRTDGRTMQDYIKWLVGTLLINAPMVIFVDRAITDLDLMIAKLRSNIPYPTEIIITELRDIPCYWMYAPIKAIIESDTWKAKCKYPQDITNQNALYTCIQYSKFEWLLKGAQIIPNKCVAWMDAGISRFFDLQFKPYQFSADLFDFDRIGRENIFVTQASRRSGNPDAIPSARTYIGTNECIIKGTMFVSTAQCIEFIWDQIQHIIRTDMLGRGAIDNEQIALALIYKDYPERFDWIPMDGDAHLNPHIFELVE